MASTFRRSLMCAGLLALGTQPVLAGIPISVSVGRPMDEKAMNQAMEDAFLCVAAVLANRPAAAETICTQVIAAVPREALGYKFRGLAYLLEQRFDKAEEDFHAAVRIDPADPENQAGYAQSFAGQGRFVQAIPYFEAALRLEPKDIRYLAASCWARAGEGSHLDLALRDCNRALQLAPKFATALQNRGLVRLKQQNWRAAIQDYSAALAQDGDRPTALFGRGYARLQTGDKEQARADIAAARQVDPDIDDLYVLQRVLPASCRDASGACPMPEDLRNPVVSGHSPLVSVGYRQRPNNPSGAEEMDEMLRSIELGRLDAMLDRTAVLLGTSLPPEFSVGWGDADLPGARRHLTQVRWEYQRQQRLACNRKLIDGRLCATPTYGTALPFVTDSASMRREIDHTIDLVQPFWQAVCFASHEPSEPCEIE